MGGDYGRWTAQAAQILEIADHLSRVANISVSQIQKLNAAGLTTLTSLAESTLAHVPRIEDVAFAVSRSRRNCKPPRSGPTSPPIGFFCLTRRPSGGA